MANATTYLTLYFLGNCNGIWGYLNKTTDSWENILCAESQPRGLIYIGDSIGAHFHMPEVWINALIFNWVRFRMLTKKKR